MRSLLCFSTLEPAVAAAVAAAPLQLNLKLLLLVLQPGCCWCCCYYVIGSANNCHLPQIKSSIIFSRILGAWLSWECFLSNELRRLSISSKTDNLERHHWWETTKIWFRPTTHLCWVVSLAWACLHLPELGEPGWLHLPETFLSGLPGCLVSLPETSLSGEPACSNSISGRLKLSSLRLGSACQHVAHSLNQRNSKDQPESNWWQCICCSIELSEIWFWWKSIRPTPFDSIEAVASSTSTVRSS